MEDAMMYNDIGRSLFYPNIGFISAPKKQDWLGSIFHTVSSEYQYITCQFLI